MSVADYWRALGRNPAVRLVLLLLGVLLILITPLVGIIPGPGGVFTFGAGAALILKYSQWAKRFYVRLERRYPKAIAWSDWALRRPSPRRREAIRKQREAACGLCG
jgi:hypothetical protein